LKIKNKREVKMKRLRYMRHAFYNKEDGGVPQKELDRIQKMAPAGKYTDVFYSPAYRSIQTALAIVAGIGLKARVHKPIGPAPKLQKIFDLMSPNGFGLLVGHAEAIEKAAADLDHIIAPLPHLGFVDFKQSDDTGKIFAF